MSAYGDTVTMVGRLEGVTLNCKFDGRDLPIAFGPNPGFPALAVDYAMVQNKIPGTMDPYNPAQFASYVGVEELGHDISPILKRSDAIEDIDRSQLAGDGAKAKRGPRRPTSQFEARVGMDLSQDTVTR